MYYYIDKKNIPIPKNNIFPFWYKGKLCPECKNENQKTHWLPGEFIEDEGYSNFTTSKSEYYRYDRLNGELINPKIKCECGWIGNCSELV